jgi:hypothetical protein
MGANHNFFNAEWTTRSRRRSFGRRLDRSGRRAGLRHRCPWSAQHPRSRGRSRRLTRPHSSACTSPRRTDWQPLLDERSSSTRWGPAHRDARLNFGYDFDAPEGSPLFGFVEEGQTRGAIDVHVIDDGEAESDETLEVDIRSVEGAAVTHPTAVVVTIVDDD